MKGAIYKLLSAPLIFQVVLVGHSIEGLNITDVLYKFPQKILVAVYLAADMMKEGYGIKLPFGHPENLYLHKDNIDILALLKRLLVRHQLLYFFLQSAAWILQISGQIRPSNW